jgi:DNA polymerase-1
MEEWKKIAGNTNMRSGKQMAALFDRFNIRYPYTDKGNPSITGEYLERVDHPVGKLAVQIRKLHHYAGTFLQSYIFDVADDDGIIHGDFHALKSDSYGTVSGRFSSGGDLNLQNIPSRDKELGPKIRGLFIPFEDRLWAKYDYSQIEYRFLGHYGGGSIQQQYNENPTVDFHDMVAQLTRIERGPAKNINFGLAYGMGVRLMAERLHLPVAEAQIMLDQYHANLPEVKRLYEKAMRKAAQRGWIRTWGGRKRRFEKYGSRYGSTHKALNALLQGSAADLIKKAMIRVNEIIDWDNMIMHLTVHDELDFSVDPGETGLKMVKEVQHAMQDWPLRVPILVDVKIGPDWGHGEQFNGNSFPEGVGYSSASV